VTFAIKNLVQKANFPENEKIFLFMYKKNENLIEIFFWGDTAANSCTGDSPQNFTVERM
jgi:hypothetical protein